jgi:diguanylate cyclase (GGDEF)-like protein/PAS domain S-box-containing protein
MTRESALEHVSRLRRLHRVQLACYNTYEDLYRAYLESGCEELGLSAGLVSRIRDGEYQVLASLHRRDRPDPVPYLSPANTLCPRVIQLNQTVAVHNVSRDPALCEHPAYQTLGVEAYLAAPIPVRGEVFGTLNFSALQPRNEPFAEDEIEFVELMAGAIGQSLERDLLDRERKAAIERMEEQATLFEGAFTHAAIGMALVGTDGRWLRVNEAVCRIFGYTEHELLTIDFQTITHPEDLDADLEQVQQLLEGRQDTYQMKKRYIHRNGSEVWGLLTVSVVRDHAGEPQYFISQIDDITAQVNAENALRIRQRQLEAANRRLDELARTDPLTGLANRREFMTRLEQEIQRSQRSGHPLCVAVMDLDHFKHYNDTHGHPEGDLALKTVADTLRETCRDMDLVARHGGEEFAILLPETSAGEGQQVAERIRRKVAEVDSLKRRISASLGVKAFEPGTHRHITPAAVQVSALLEDADQGLYEAKSVGRNQVRLARDWS